MFFFFPVETTLFPPFIEKDIHICQEKYQTTYTMSQGLVPEPTDLGNNQETWINKIWMKRGLTRQTLDPTLEKFPYKFLSPE